MKKTITLLLVTLCVVSIFFVFPARVYSQQATTLKVLSYSWYMSVQSGNLIVVGEVQNTGSEIIYHPTITGTVYTIDQQAQATTDYSLTYSNEILPNDTAPFYMVFTAERSINGSLSWVSTGIDHVDFKFYASTTQDAPYSGLLIVANASTVDELDNYAVGVAVLNTGNLYPERLWVVASFYNASGTVVAVGTSSYASPHYLAPGNTTTLVVIISDPISKMNSEIVGYKLKVLSDGVVATSPTPSPSPSPTETPSPSLSENPTSSPSDSSAPQETPNSQNGLYVPMSTIYAIIAAVVIVVVVIMLAFIVRKKINRVQQPTTPQ
jgi:hypothetical protein